MKRFVAFLVRNIRSESREHSRTRLRRLSAKKTTEFLPNGFATSNSLVLQVSCHHGFQGGSKQSTVSTPDGWINNWFACWVTCVILAKPQRNKNTVRSAVLLRCGGLRTMIQMLILWCEELTVHNHLMNFYSILTDIQNIQNRYNCFVSVQARELS